MESSWSLESSKGDCRGQNSMAWTIPYIIEKLLELTCLKWARMTHLDIENTSYSQKKGRESNWQFNSRPLKVGNWPNSLAFRLRATYRWKAFDKGYNFASDLISIGCLHAKLWGPKVVGVPMLAILGLPLQSLGTKCHLDVGLVERHKIYYKGEGGGFPQVQAMVSFVSPSLPGFNPGFNYALTDLLFGLCTSVWVIKCLSFFLVPSWSSNKPLYPSKCYELRSVPPTPCSSIVVILGSHLSLSRSLGARHYMVATT
jgi:hypothetical protein